MGLQALVFCTDEKIVRVLRRVLSDLEVAVEHCLDSDSSTRKLTRQRFEAVIVDCAEQEKAAQILKSCRIAPCNKRAIAVAIVDGQTALRNAFELGAHFVLYKPISMERAKASFRAARALMKRERRRNTRIPVEIPVTLVSEKGDSRERSFTIDLSEGGIAVQLERPSGNIGPVRVQFTLPGTDYEINCRGEVAWENPRRQAGIRFQDLPADVNKQIKSWINTHGPESEQDDPPVHCKLTDLSLGGCYLEMSAPFPMRTRVTLSMRVSSLEVQAEGVVRVVHPEFGMGVEFTQNTPEQRHQVEKFIHALTNSNGIVPDLLVEPEGLEPFEGIRSFDGVIADDPLVELFYNKAALTTEEFQAELRRQRRCETAPAV